MKKRSIFFFILLLTFNIPLIYSTTDEGYGEDNENLGQFVDSFENDDNVSVAINIINNQTLECMELNYTGITFEWSEYYFTEYFENFPNGWTTAQGGSGTITKDNTHVYNGSWSSKHYAPDLIDYAYGYIGMESISGDYDLQFQIYPDGEDQPDDCYVMFLFDVGPGTNILIMLDYQLGDYYIKNMGTNVGLVIADQWNQINVFFNDTTNKLKYYINLEYKGEFDIVGDTDPDRIYIGSTSSAQQSGIFWLDDLLIGNNSLSSGYEFDGYFTTTELLSGINGSSLILMTNSTLNNGDLEVQFSINNSTWVDHNNQSSHDDLSGGFESFDLRNINSKTIYLRYNFTVGTSTPRLYQSRLVTTKGVAVVSGGINSSAILIVIFLCLIGSIVLLGVRKR